MNLPEGDPRHGHNGYTNYQCRCILCREGQRLYQQDYRKRRRNSPEFARVVHGQPDTYCNWSCRCVECIEAWRLSKRKVAS